jgi:hypothetical protein
LEVRRVRGHRTCIFGLNRKGGQADWT